MVEEKEPTTPVVSYDWRGRGPPPGKPTSAGKVAAESCERKGKKIIGTKGRRAAGTLLSLALLAIYLEENKHDGTIILIDILSFSLISSTAQSSISIRRFAVDGNNHWYKVELLIIMISSKRFKKLRENSIDRSVWQMYMY